MKLDRNINPIEANGARLGKYALLKLRRLQEIRMDAERERATKGTKARTLDDRVHHALDVLAQAGILDWGYAGTEGEFFVIRLRDQHARAALWAYATHASSEDIEYAEEISALCERAGPASPFCKKPD